MKACWRISAAVAVALSTGFAAIPAQAATIITGSTINFAGQSTCTETSCTFGNAVVTGGTGSFSGFTFLTPASFFTVSYDPFTPQQIYTVTNAALQTASFFATSQLTRSTQTVGGLTTYSFTDLGIARLTGFEDTLGTFVFSANQNGTLQGSFSGTTAIVAGVPEPATWAMMIGGFGIVGASLRKRRRSTKVSFA